MRQAARRGTVDGVIAEDTEPHVKAVPVREHRFGAGREYLVGVEEELMLVDAATGAPAPVVEQLLCKLRDDRVKPELMQCQVELATSPCASTEDALAELAALRADAVRAAALDGVRVAGAGTHPFSLAEEQAITSRDRYRELLAALRYPARRELCFGMHVHVSIQDADKAVRVIEGLLPELPLLLALSASSPFWRGAPSGLFSTRTAIFQAMPRSGVPPAFAGYEEFACGVELLGDAGLVPDHSQLWWDVRPHPRFGTVEVRCMDAQAGVVDAVALAGLVQALVRHLGRRYDQGELFADADRLVVAENRWQAARHGLHARFAVPGSRGAAPAREALVALLDRIADDAEAVGAAWALDHVAWRAHAGTSADRQLRLARAGRSLPQIVSLLADETEAGI
jgi:carboxylate-amine ligase